MSAPLHGQVTGTGTGNVLPLSSSPVSCSVFTIRAAAANTKPVALGSSAVTYTTGHLLDPGMDFTYERNELAGDARRELSVSDFYVCATTGDVVSWFASPK